MPLPPSWLFLISRIQDSAAIQATRLQTEAGIVSGRSGAGGVEAVLLAGEDCSVREIPGLGDDNRVRSFSLEGRTAPPAWDGWAECTLASLQC